MSTRSSIAYGDGFHLYHEMMDEGENVHLRLDGVHYSAGPEGVTVEIPIAIWEFIRHQGGASLDLVNMTDDDLQKKVATDVDARIAEYVFAEERMKPMLAFFGSGTYGGANESRELQVQAGLEHWTKERARQREVAAKLAALKARAERT